MAAMTPAARWLAEVDAQMAKAFATCESVRKGESSNLLLMDSRCVNFVVEHGERVRAMVAALQAGRTMVANIAGILSYRETEMRQLIGNTNYQVAMDTIAAFDTALAALDASHATGE